jgi:hypothetical protein
MERVRKRGDTMMNPMELKRQAEALGYRTRMLEARRIKEDGEVMMFCIERSGAYVHRWALDPADFAYFEFNAEGLKQARSWLDEKVK